MAETQPHAVIVAGPNGAGKSTLAPRLLVGRFQVPTYVNADVIAQGLAGFDPASAAIQAGRIMLARIAELRRARADFAIESTLSGLSLRKAITELVADGYAIHLLYLCSPIPKRRWLASRAAFAWADTMFPSRTFAGAFIGASATSSGYTGASQQSGWCTMRRRWPPVRT